MAEEQGQAATQPAEPSLSEIALNIAKSQLSEEGRARDNSGRFVPKEGAETKGTEEAPPEDRKAEAASEEKQAEVKESKEEKESKESEEPAQPEVRKHKIKVKTEDGADEEIEVDDEELKRGYMKSKDYSVKTAQLARDREAVQAKVREAVEPELKKYEAQLESYKQAVLKLADPEAISADLNKVATEDPAKAQQLFFKRIEIQNTLQAIAAEQQKIAEQRGQEAQQTLRKQAAAAVEVLKTDLPGWGDELYGKILKTGVSEYGFKPEEVNAITDHRAIKVLHDAMQYRALKSTKPAVDKRASAEAPKVVKPGAGEKPDASEAKWKDSYNRLRETGKTQDAFEVAKLILSRERRQ